ncbi:MULTISPECIES: hypothetical protein [Luteibacter]|uniref:hypothetical protein n=1 Tax=Luteibacter TaxID=242605 RepID=UPI000561389E|nr:MULTISPECIES: hypothetical protein [unclassified Luteibacter]
MKRSIHTWVWWLFVPVVLMTAAIWRNPLPPGTRGIPIRQAFPLDRAGKSTTIDFWLREEEADLSRRFMIAIEFPAWHNAATSFIRNARPAIRAQVWRVDGGDLATVNLLDMDGIYAAFGKSRQWNPSSSAPTRALLHMRPDGNDDKTEYVLVGGFYAQEFGHYRACIEAAYDLPILEDIQSEIVVDQIYNGGK